MRPATAMSSSAYRPAPASGSRYSAAQPLACDPEIARLFLELRQYLGLSIPDVAHRLATRADVIAALEAGRLDRLPAWPETARVVSAYIALASLDPRAALERISDGMRAAATGRAAPTPAVPQSANPVSRIVRRLSQPTSQGEGDPAWTRLTGRLGDASGAARKLLGELRSARHPVRWVLAGAAGLILVASASPSGVLQASVNGISSPISGLWRSLGGQFSQVTITVREGHQWIETDDPRSRRTDKLPMPRS